MARSRVIVIGLVVAAMVAGCFGPAALRDSGPVELVADQRSLRADGEPVQHVTLRARRRSGQWESLDGLRVEGVTTDQRLIELHLDAAGAVSPIGNGERGSLTLAVDVTSLLSQSIAFLRFSLPDDGRAVLLLPIEGIVPDEASTFPQVEVRLRLVNSPVAGETDSGAQRAVGAAAIPSVGFGRGSFAYGPGRLQGAGSGGTQSSPSFASRAYPGEEYVPDEWIVELDESYTVHGIVDLTGPGVRRVRRLGDGPYYLIVADGGEEGVRERLERLPMVRSVGRNQRVYPASWPLAFDDEYYSYQWNLSLISVPEVWRRVGADGRGVIVAVLDTGLRPDHPDFEGQSILPGRNFVDDQPPDDYRDRSPHLSHGTMVAGIIAAATGNGRGIAGAAPRVSLLPVRVMSSDFGGTVTAVGEGIRWAVDQGANVINMSLAWKPGDPDDPAEAFVRRQIEYAASKGVVMIAGSGNDDGPVLMPASHPDVIAVGAVDRSKKRTRYANYGPDLELVAPGGDTSVMREGGVLSTDVVSGAPGYSFRQGTSLAAPHVTAVAALLYGLGLTDADAIRERLRTTAEDLGPAGFDVEYGYGLVNAYAAVTGADVTAALVGVADEEGEMLSGPVAVNATARAWVPFVAGSHYVFAWLDVSGEGAVDAGDFAALAPIGAEIARDGIDLALVPLGSLPEEQRVLLMKMAASMAAGGEHNEE